jgi:hypothetical protein
MVALLILIFLVLLIALYISLPTYFLVEVYVEDRLVEKSEVLLLEITSALKYADILASKYDKLVVLVGTRVKKVKRFNYFNTLYHFIVFHEGDILCKSNYGSKSIEEITMKLEIMINGHYPGLDFEDFDIFIGKLV